MSINIECYKFDMNFKRNSYCDFVEKKITISLRDIKVTKAPFFAKLSIKLIRYALFMKRKTTQPCFEYKEYTFP